MRFAFDSTLGLMGASRPMVEISAKMVSKFDYWGVVI